MAYFCCRHIHQTEDSHGIQEDSHEALLRNRPALARGPHDQRHCQNAGLCPKDRSKDDSPAETFWNDFPENVRAVLHSSTHQHLIANAGRIGPNFRKLIRDLLSNHAFIYLRRAQGLLRLAEKHPRQEMEEAALYLVSKHIEPSVKTVKRLLEASFDNTEGEVKTPDIGEQTRSFIRAADYFINP